MSTTTPHTDPHTAKIFTGLTDSTHSSCSSSTERYGLDDSDTSPILVYKYLGGLRTSSQKELSELVEKDEKLRVTKKAIPRGSSFIEVRRNDLFLPEEKDLYGNLPTDSSLSGIKIPSRAYWSRLFFGSYDNLYMLSLETTPISSIADEDSRRTSPSSTWGQDSETSAHTGATRDPLERD